SQGSAISYWFKSEPAGEVRITISDVAGREIRVLTGTKNAGLNRVQWDLRGTRVGGGGRQGRGAEDTPTQAPVAAAPQAGARGVATAAAPPAGAATGGGRGGGRGGFGPAVAPGTYLVKVM